MRTRKRKPPLSGIDRLQIANLYTPVIRPRNKRSSDYDSQLIIDAFLPNSKIVWGLTSNSTICKNGEKGFNIRLSKRLRKTDGKAKRRYSVLYKTIVEAEDNAFMFRYNLEDKSTRLKLDEYKTNLSLCLSNSAMALPISPIETPSKRIRQPSTQLKKKYRMSGSYALNVMAGKSNNPNNMYTAVNDSGNLELAKACALKIQRYVRNRDLQRGLKKVKMNTTNHTYRLSLIKYLSKFIANNNCEELLLGADDPEILATYSLYDKQHVTTKARHITDALVSLSDAHQGGRSTTWIQCCEAAVQKNYNEIKSARTVADWYLQLHELSSLKFRRSARGRSSYFAVSPFSEDECLTVQFKSWARQDLEHLTVKKAQDFINEKLLSQWSAEQLLVSKISFPVSECVVSRWLREAGFKYEKYKKCYYVDRHEDNDVVSDRKTYCSRFFRDEIYEHCWFQLSRKKYIALKYRNRLKVLETKRNGKGLSNMESKINSYIDENVSHYYKKDGEDMVEIHVDELYKYDDIDKNLPPLGLFGGNRSVRLPADVKARLCFGQDEAIFRSSQLNESCWTIDGQNTLRTKGLGVGVMVSAMVSRAFGMGLEITAAQLLVINEIRNGKKYADEEAATHLFGNAAKKPLKESPFVQYLEYGSGKDGYWTYRHMVIQIENCIDCLSHLYPQFDYEFELDHSSGHNSERPDGLTTTKTAINLGWGGDKGR